ncbi:unnamed protein product [Camellia sinensis]
MATWFIGGSGGRRGGRNLQRGESSRRGGGRGSGDAEDETPFPFLDASCAYHDRFGKRHFVMPKYYRDPCGLVEDPSENQTGYGYAKARLLKWPALFIERVQNERLCRERRLKVPKARSVAIQKEDPDNVDRLCQTLQREISQMGHRLRRMPRRTKQNQMLRLSRLSWRILNLSLTLSFRIVQTLSHLSI